MRALSPPLGAISDPNIARPLEVLLKTIVDLAAGSNRVKEALVSAGALPALLHLIDLRARPQPSSEIARLACTSIQNLSLCPEGDISNTVVQALLDAGAVPVLVRRLSECGSFSSEPAVHALSNLT